MKLICISSLSSTCLFFLIVINVMYIHFNDKNCVKQTNQNHYMHHTNVYNDFYKEDNSLNMFFDEHTFGMNVYDNPCEEIKYSSKFRKAVNNKFDCDGIWCINNTFACDKNRDCYHVEHIIDKNGPEFNDACYNKNIAGNLIMAWSRWNSELGTLAQHNYNYSHDEKIQIYGANIVYNAKNNIIKCSSCNTRNNTGNIKNKSGNIPTGYIFLIILLTIFMTNGIINCMLCNKYRDEFSRQSQELILRRLANL